MGALTRLRKYVDGRNFLRTLMRARSGSHSKAWGCKPARPSHLADKHDREIAMTCHLVMKDGRPGDAFLHDLATELAHE